MAQSHIVTPIVVRLTLSTGEFVDVIKELNAGEYWDLLAAMADRVPFAKILAYVTGWSFVSLDGQPLPYSLDLPATVRRDTVRSLNKHIVRELQVTLDRHEQTEETERTAKKKAPAGPDTGTES